jgi:hypothetical protein
MIDDSFTISLTKDEVNLLCEVLSGVKKNIDMFHSSDENNKSKAVASTLSLYKKIKEL